MLQMLLRIFYITDYKWSLSQTFTITTVQNLYGGEMGGRCGTERNRTLAKDKVVKRKGEEELDEEVHVLQI